MRSLFAALLLIAVAAMLTVSSQDASSASHCRVDEFEVTTFLSGITHSACCDSATECAYNNACSDFGSRPVGTSYYCGVGSELHLREVGHGIIYGTVVNSSGHGQDGVSVRAVNETLDENKTVQTDDSGRYFMQVKLGIYYINASHPDSGYKKNVTSGFRVAGLTERNYTLVRPLQIGCNDDCTRSDGLCHKECAGQGLCHFFNSTTADLCHLSVPGVIDYSNSNTEQLTCCMGAPEPPLKANVSVCDTNSITVARSVILNGRRVNLVMVLFNNCAP